MKNRLFVTVLGHPQSGKTTTWNTLFGRTVRTGSQTRDLPLKGGECVNVFLVSGSPEERNLYVGDILGNQSARIVLCSMQYTESARQTLSYVLEEDFDLYAQWLNPGYNDAGETFDRLGFSGAILGQGGVMSVRDAQASALPRVQEIREYIYGWASYRGLIYPCRDASPVIPIN